MRFALLLILGSFVLIRPACVAQTLTGEKASKTVVPKVVLPGEKFDSVTVPKNEVRLIVSRGGVSRGEYITVKVEDGEMGLMLYLVEHMPNGKPNQSLQERTVTVHLRDGKKKRKLSMKNVSGFLSSRRPLPDADSWELNIELKGVRSGIDDDRFDVKFKKEWVKRRAKPSSVNQGG